MTAEPTTHADNFADVVRDSVRAGAVLRLTVGELTTSCTGATAQRIIELLSATADTELAELPAELSTGQVAQLLGVSRPTVVSLIEAGALPASRIGTHRRVSAMDAVDYRDRHRAKRRAALDELSALSQEAGLYD